MPAQVSAAHAARMYGRSRKTVRRWIAAGKLPAEKVDGAYLVDLADVARLVGDVSAPTPAPVSAQRTDTEVRPGDEDVRPPERRSALARADALASLIRATLTPIVAPLVAELAAGRQANERLADQLLSQAETIGRQSERVAELEQENSRLSAMLLAARSSRASPVAPQPPVEAPTAPGSAEPTPEPPAAPGRVWWFWLVLLAPIIATAIVVVVVLLAVPR